MAGGFGGWGFGPGRLARGLAMLAGGQRFGARGSGSGSDREQRMPGAGWLAPRSATNGISLVAGWLAPECHELASGARRMFWRALGWLAGSATNSPRRRKRKQPWLPRFVLGLVVGLVLCAPLAVMS